MKPFWVKLPAISRDLIRGGIEIRSSEGRERVMQAILVIGLLVSFVCCAYFSYSYTNSYYNVRPSLMEIEFGQLTPSPLGFISDQDRETKCPNLKPITSVEDLLDLELPDSPELRRFNKADINGNRVEQDDPSLLQYFWDNCDVLMKPPDGKPTTYKYMNASMGQDEIVRRIFKNMTGGFFLEVGAYDGVTSSNTLELERDLGWKGLLIEAGKNELAKLHQTHRNAWISHSCIAVRKYPHEVIFRPNSGSLGMVVKVLGDQETNPDQNRPADTKRIQCFPLYTFLAALNVTVLDFLSLDVEGFELDILKTIPFEKILIKVIAVEIVTAKEGPIPFKEFMEANGFRTLGIFYDAKQPFDLIFVHASIPIDATVLDLLKPKKTGRYYH